MPQNYTLYPYNVQGNTNFQTNAFFQNAPTNSFTLPQNNNTPMQNASIFDEQNNKALTLPAQQTEMLPTISDTGLPNPEPAANPSLSDEIKGTLVMGGAFSAIPLATTPFQSLRSIGTTSKLLDGNAMIKAGASAEDVAKAYSEAHRIERFSNAITKVDRNPEETKKIMDLLKKLREEHKKALASGNKILAEAYAQDMRTVVNKAKTPLLFRWKKPAQEFSQVTKGLKTVSEKGKIIPANKIQLPKTITKVMGNVKVGGALAAAVEVPEVITAFSEGGAKEGIKQTGKSTVKAAAGMTGWWAGAKVGGIAGAKIGAVVGAWFGGVGAAPGAAIGGFLGGLIGGAVGMWGANKLSNAAVGESFSEKKAKSQQQIIQPETQQVTPQETQTETPSTVPTKQKDAQGTTENKSATKDLTQIVDNPDEDFIKEIDALLTKYYNGTATEEEKAIVKARTEAAKAKVKKEFNPYMFDPMFCGSMSSPMNPFAFC